MRTNKLWYVLILLSAFVHAGETRVGKITATAPTAKNNSTTAVPFTLGGNTKLSIQCDAVAFVLVTTNSAALATADDVKIAADQLFPTSTPSGVGATYISILPASGTANCKVYIRSGNEV